MTPTLTWSAPTLGTATSYTVTIQGTSGQLLSATAYETSFAVPPGILFSGNTYWAAITANYGPWDAIDRAVNRGGVPFDWADCVTNVFTP